MLSEQSQVSESLAEECEAVGEARPPRKVVRIGGFTGAASGVFCRSNAGAKGSTIVCVCDLMVIPKVEEFMWPLELCSGLRLWRATVLVTTARVTVAYLWLFSQVVVV